MGIFGRKTPEEVSEIDRLRVDVKIQLGPDSVILDLLDQYSANKYINVFDTEENLIVFIRTIINNPRLRKYDFNTLYEEAGVIYKDIKKSGYTFNETLIHFFENNGLYEKGLISMEIMAAFEYVENYFSVMTMVSKYAVAMNNMEETTRLILAISMLTPNDIELRSMLAYFFQTSALTGNYTESIDAFISFAKKRAGVYDELDEKYLAKMELLVQRADEVIGRYQGEEEKITLMTQELRTLRGNVQKLIASYDESIKNFDTRISGVTSKYEDQLQQSYLDRYADLKKDYEDLLGRLTSNTKAEAQKLAREAVSKMESDARTLAQVRASYETSTSTSLSQLEEIKREATSEVKKGLEDIRKIIEGTGISSSEDIKKISDLLKNVGTVQVQETPAIVTSPTILTGDILAPGAAITSKEEGIKIPDVITSFDATIKFNKRLDAIMEKKRSLEAKGTVFNKVIDDCIYFMVENKSIYLFGPSGTGKNYFVKQLSNLFGIPYVNIGYIMEEYELIGGRTATGAYAPSNFYECWRNGYIAFCDELDNGVPQATIKLNGFMDNDGHATYNFPVIGFVDRHPNFRLIAAGNTKGMGATRAHNVRTKLDESVQQRFKYIPFDYDPNVEKAILKNYPEWLEFINLFREAVKEYWACQEDDIQGQITTRDISDIRDYLVHGVFSPDKILKYEFIEAKDKDYLSTVSAYMKSNENQIGKEGKKLVKQFSSLVDNNE